MSDVWEKRLDQARLLMVELADVKLQLTFWTKKKKELEAAIEELRTLEVSMSELEIAAEAHKDMYPLTMPITPMVYRNGMPIGYLAATDKVAKVIPFYENSPMYLIVDFDLTLESYPDLALYGDKDGNVIVAKAGFRGRPDGMANMGFGNPIKLGDYADPEAGIFISTVHSPIPVFVDSDKPIYFESMVTTKDEHYPVRYDTNEEAIAGHDKLVDKYTKKT
jgi:hypothetical protein